MESPLENVLANYRYKLEEQVSTAKELNSKFSNILNVLILSVSLFPAILGFIDKIIIFEKVLIFILLIMLFVGILICLIALNIEPLLVGVNDEILDKRLNVEKDNQEQILLEDIGLVSFNVRKNREILTRYHSLLRVLIAILLLIFILFIAIFTLHISISYLNNSWFYD